MLVQNLLDEFMLFVNSPVKAILTLHEAKWNYPLQALKHFIKCGSRLHLQLKV
jgi:hypothetical protein